MHAPTLTVLEFPRIAQELAAFTACQLGKELAMGIAPLPSSDRIRQAQHETSEAKALLASGRSVPFGSIADVRLFVERATLGGVLRPDQLIAVADTIYGCRQLQRFLTEQRSAVPTLSRYAEAFGQFDDLETEIRRAIEHGKVSSRASHNLKQIRSEMTVLEGRIQDRLSGLLKQYRQQLQDALVTTRNGRYVIPVRAEMRGSVPGTVHGTSASGSTLFIEPAAISQLCGELETWQALEEAEVQQVLLQLSGRVAAHGHGLQSTLGAVAELDFIFAKARLSLAWNAQPVAWNDSGLIDLKSARHPLLGRSAIPNRIRLTADRRMLIVTGPNTGGKTLLLKTLGLLVIVARCGLHIPVDEGSTLCDFAEVFAEIGDHQNLAESLSTFSGHIAAVAPMLAEAGSRTLVLLDELGSGTDPHEGTGLGIALLEAFLAKGAYTLVTTHLREIKEFGRVTPGCEYAGMGFDGETLQPTYRLLYDTLGESHGLEIAARAGLPVSVVARARTLVYGEGAAEALGSGVAPGTGAAVPALEPVVSGVRPVSSVPQPVPSVSWPMPPAIAALPIVLAVPSSGRCRVAISETEHEVSLADHVRRRQPGGLVPGDRVRVQNSQIIEVAARRNMLVKRDADTQAESVVAANLTRMLILSSTRHPDFTETVLARHLFYAERQSITPIICLTKSDLVAQSVADGWLEPFRRSGYQALAVSALKGRGLAELVSALAGQVTAVFGVAGVGKRTLLGSLHLAPDSWLIETPGLRELGVWKPDLAGGFHEFGPFVGRCSRPGCMHRQEPDCSVRAAVEQGQIPSASYERYLQLLRHMRLA